MAKKVKVIRRRNAKLERSRKLGMVAAPGSFRRAADGTATISVTLATERPVLRSAPEDAVTVDGVVYDRYYEVLTMRGLNTQRINGKRGIPFLNAHQADDANRVLGRSIPNTLKVSGKEAVIDFKLGKRAASAGYTDDIENGVLADTSVGYCIRAYEFQVPDRGIPTLRATDWVPHENSLVPVPADQDAVIRSRGGKRVKRKREDEDLDDDEREDDLVAEDDEDQDDESERDDDVEGDDEDQRSDEDPDDDDVRAEDDEDADDSESDDDDPDDDESDEEREDDLADDDDDTAEERSAKARARAIRAKARAKRAAKRGATVVLDPRRNAAVRSLMSDARDCGVFKPVDAIRRAGGTMQQIRAAMIRAYTGVGQAQARNAIRSRPDIGARRAAEDGPFDVDQQHTAPTDAEILATVRRRKQKLARL